MITCVFVVHNVPSRPEPYTMTQQCLNTFFETVSDNLDAEVILIDNGSADNGLIFNLLTSYMNHARVVCKRFEANEPIARCWNWAITQASGDVIVLLNNDVIFHKSTWLPELVAPLYRGQAIGVTGSRTMSWNGFVFVEGAFIAFRKNFALELADSGIIFDEQFEFTGEDVDFCHRAVSRGRQLVATGIEDRGLVTHIGHGTLSWSNADGGWNGRSILDVMHESRKRLCRKYHMPERVND